MQILLQVSFLSCRFFSCSDCTSTDCILWFMTHHQHPAVLADSLYIKTGLFLTENGDQRACCVGNQV